MKITNPLFSSNRPFSRWVGILGVVILFVIIVLYLTTDARNPRWSGFTGVHHMGEDFVVPEFYINGTWGGNIGKEGGGGSNVCCVALPKEWSPRLVVDVRWSVSNWANENVSGTSARKYSSVSWQFFRAIVPVEQYTGEPDHLYVHFFKNGAVRVVTSMVGPESPMHPIRGGDSQAAVLATNGKSASSIFSNSEVEQMRINVTKNEGNSKGR